MHSSTMKHSYSSQNLQQQHTSSSSSFVIKTSGPQQFTIQPNHYNQSTTKFGQKREIEAQSSSSIDINTKQKQQLMMKVLMMAFQIQRKDCVVKNLLKELQTLQTRSSIQSSQQVYVLKQQLSRHKRIIEDLQYKLSQLQLTNNQLAITRSSTTKQLQEKLSILETRLKQVQLHRIQLQSINQNLVTQKNMLNYKLVSSESTQKGKQRQALNKLQEAQKRLQEQKKVSNQLKIVVEAKTEEVKMVRDNYERIIRQLQDKMREFSHSEDLKRSQAVVSQQKIEMTQQELVRVQDQVRYFRKKLDEQHSIAQKRETQLVTEIKRYKDMQAELFHSRHQIAIMKTQLQQKHITISSLTKDMSQLKTTLKQVQQAREQSSIQHTTSYQQQFSLMQQQTQTYRLRLREMQEDLDRVRQENRRMKRNKSTTSNQNLLSANGECQSCKILLSSTSIKSNKQINDLNLADIIQQTQKLHDNAMKIQQILSSRRIVYTAGWTQSESERSYQREA